MKSCEEEDEENDSDYDNSQHLYHLFKTFEIYSVRSSLFCACILLISLPFIQFSLLACLLNSGVLSNSLSNIQEKKINLTNTFLAECRCNGQNFHLEPVRNTN